MSVAMTAIRSNGDATDLSSYTTTSETPTTSALQLLAVANAKGTPTTPTVTGCGLTWVQVDTVAFNTAAGPAKRITLFRALGTASAGALTIDFGGTTQNGCSWSWSEYTGIDTSGTNGSGAIVQHVTNTVDANPLLTVTLAAFSSVDNATYGAFAATLANILSPGSGFTQIHEVSFTPPNVQLLTEWRVDNDTTVDASEASGTPGIGGIAVEIKAAAGTVSVAGTTAGTSTTTGDLTQAGTISIAGTTAGTSTVTGEFVIAGTGWVWEGSITDGTGRVTCGAYDGTSRWYSGSDTAGVHRSTASDRGLEAFMAGLHKDPGNGSLSKVPQHCAGIAASTDTVVHINGHSGSGGTLQTRLAADTTWRVNTRYFGDGSNATAGGGAARPTGRRVFISGALVWASCQDSNASNHYGIARSADYGVTWTNWSFGDDRQYTGLFLSPSISNVLYATADGGGAGAPGVYVITGANGTGVFTRIDNQGTNHPTFTSPRDVVAIHEGSNDVIYVVADSTDASGGIWRCVVGDPTAGGWTAGSVTWSNVTPGGTGGADWNSICGKRTGSVTYLMAGNFNASTTASGSYTLGDGINESGNGTKTYMATHMRSLDSGATWTAVSGSANVPQPTVIYGTGGEVWVQGTAKDVPLNDSRLGGHTHSVGQLVVDLTNGTVMSFGKGGVWRCDNPWSVTPVWKPFVRGLGGINVDTVAMDPTDNNHIVHTDTDRHGYQFFDGGDGQPKCYFDSIPGHSFSAWVWPPVALNNNKGQTLVGNGNIVSVNTDPWNINSNFSSKTAGSVTDQCRFGYNGNVITLVLSGGSILRWTTAAMTGAGTNVQSGIGNTGQGGMVFCAIDENPNVYLFTTSGWWRSTNAGAAWTKISTHSASGPNEAECKCAQDRLHPTVLWYTLSGSNGLYRVTNAATTFNVAKVTGGLLGGSAYTGPVAVDPLTGDVVVVLTAENSSGSDILYAAYGSTNFQSIGSTSFPDLCDLPMSMQYVDDRIVIGQAGAGLIRGVRGSATATGTVSGTTGGYTTITGDVSMSWSIAGTSAGSSTALLDPSAVIRGPLFVTGTTGGTSTAALYSGVTPPPLAASYFLPPTREDLSPLLPTTKGLQRRLWRHYASRTRGLSVLKIDGVYVTIDGPTIAQCDSATEVYLGGHYTLVTPEQQNALLAAGYGTPPNGSFGSSH